MGKEVTKYETNDKRLLYVGTKDGEEYYKKTDKNRVWSFMGLRPETEETLRERGRETMPENVGMKIPSHMAQFFDYAAFADAMEEDWYDRHDVQAQRADGDGETLYLGFGSGQSVGGYFKEHGITDYTSYCKWFDDIGLTEKEFNKCD